MNDDPASVSSAGVPTVPSRGTPGHSGKVAAGWPLWQRLAFRYLLCYFVLYAFPGPLGTLFSKQFRWVDQGCRTAGIGCLDCKKPLIEKVVEEISGMRKRAQEFEDSPELLRNIVTEGADKAREAARATLDEVRRAMHLRAD